MSATPNEFLYLMEQLTDQSAQIATALRLPGLAARRWQIPLRPGFSAFDNIQEPAMIAYLVPRDFLNMYYFEEMEHGPAANRGRVGRAGALQGAIDYMAAFERALQAALAGRARCRAWSSARRNGHGSREAGVFATVYRHLILSHAAASFYPNSPQRPANPVAGGATNSHLNADGEG